MISFSQWQVPRIDPEDRWVGGVAAAIAAEVGVQPIVIRSAFVVLALSAGWGVIIYAAAWVGLLVVSSNKVFVEPYLPKPKSTSGLHRHVAIFLIVVGLGSLLASDFVQYGPFLRLEALEVLVWPVGCVIVGGLIAWTRGRDAETGGLSSVARIVAGVVVVVVGLVGFSFEVFEGSSRWFGLLIMLAVLAGVGVVVGPTILRMGQTIDTERFERVRSDERARVAAHLHDSVLQTLSLIQRNAEDRVRVTQLARQQERELRGWLYGAKPAEPGTVLLGPSLEEAATMIEADHDVQIEIVSVGDSSGSGHGDIEGLVSAAREAMLNAAKHSGAGKIDVFAERDSSQIEIFVRDTGAGFVPSEVATDRRGLRDSIVGRMERLGGSVIVDTEPGVGTEIQLRLPLTSKVGQSNLFKERSEP